MCLCFLPFHLFTGSFLNISNKKNLSNHFFTIYYENTPVCLDGVDFVSLCMKINNIDVSYLIDLLDYKYIFHTIKCLVRPYRNTTSCFFIFALQCFLLPLLYTMLFYLCISASFKFPLAERGRHAASKEAHCF